MSEARGASSAPGSPDFFDWIENDSSVRWSQFKRTLWRKPGDEARTSPALACSGSPSDTIARLTSSGIKVLGLWHVTCRNLPLTTSDRASVTYWAERWELYRWFYLGGRFFAGAGVEDIELYNEPNLQDCIPAGVFLDDIRVRSLALQHAFEDHNRRTGNSRRAVIIGPSISAPRLDYGTHGLAFGRMAIQDVHTKFPSLENDPSWRNMHEFAYHQYNAPGYGMKSAWDKVVAAVDDAAGPLSVPVRVTEHNAWASRTAAESAPGRDVMDTPSTAAVLAGQVAALVGRADHTSVHKFSQTYADGPAGVAKNGLLWGDLGQDRTKSGMCNLGGTTKSGEAYRLLLQRTPGRRQLMVNSVDPPLKSMSNFSTFTVADSLGYYVYLINASPATHTVTLEAGALPGVAAGTPVVVSAVGPTHHGEVRAVEQLYGPQGAPLPKNNKKKKAPTKKKGRGAEAVLPLTLGPSTVLMATVPRGSPGSALLSSIEDTMVSAGAKAGAAEGGSAASLTVRTSSSDPSATSAAYFKFDLVGIAREKIVSAVLTLTQANIGSSEGPQILTVLGTSAGWTEGSLTWSTAPGLRSLDRGVSCVADNFINFDSSKLVGHLTAGVVGQPTLSLDVADYLRAGGDASFALVRMFRFDQRGSGGSTMPADRLGGPVTLLSRESASGRPLLRVIYQK